MDYGRIVAARNMKRRHGNMQATVQSRGAAGRWASRSVTGRDLPSSMPEGADGMLLCSPATPVLVVNTCWKNVSHTLPLHVPKIVVL